MNKNQKSDLQCSKYHLIKVGRLNSPKEMLFIRPKKNEWDCDPINGEKFYRVFKCKEEDDQYVFCAPCPTCGEFHRHGNIFGHRCAHCFHGPVNLMKLVHGKGYTESYFIASEEEFRKLWRYAKDYRRVNGI